MPTEPRHPTESRPLAEPRSRGRWWIAPVLGVVVVVTAVAALVAHNLYQQPLGSSVGAAGTSTPAVSTSAPGQTTTPVTLTPDAANSPLHQQVQAALQKYFDAINDKDYGSWSAVVTSNLSDHEPQPLFVQGYGTTSDDRITVFRVDSTPDDGVRVLVTFRSKQALAQAPLDFQHGCIMWRVVWPLVWDENRHNLKVDAGMSGKTPQRQVC